MVGWLVGLADGGIDIKVYSVQIQLNLLVRTELCNLNLTIGDPVPSSSLIFTFLLDVNSVMTMRNKTQTVLSMVVMFCTLGSNCQNCITSENLLANLGTPIS